MRKQNFQLSNVSQELRWQGPQHTVSHPISMASLFLSIPTSSVRHSDLVPDPRSLITHLLFQTHRALVKSTAPISDPLFRAVMHWCHAPLITCCSCLGFQAGLGRGQGGPGGRGLLTDLATREGDRVAVSSSSPSVPRSEFSFMVFFWGVSCAVWGVVGGKGLAVGGHVCHLLHPEERLSEDPGPLWSLGSWCQVKK